MRSVSVGHIVSRRSVRDTFAVPPPLPSSDVSTSASTRVDTGVDTVEGANVGGVGTGDIRAGGVSIGGVGIGGVGIWGIGWGVSMPLPPATLALRLGVCHKGL